MIRFGLPLAAAALLAAACHHPAPPSAEVGNRGAIAATCAEATPPFEFVADAPSAGECVHGASEPLLRSDDALPSCHRFTPRGTTGSIETVRLDGRPVWVEQYGCVHAGVRVVGAPARPVGRDRREQLMAAASLLRALPSEFLPQLGDEIAVAAERAPTGSFALGAGDWTAEVEVLPGGEVSVTLDFPL